MNTINVIILAGGMGTRLKPVISDSQKVLATVWGRSFLSFLLDQLIQAGFSRVILSTGYEAEQVEAEFGQTYKSLFVVYSKEVSPLGTGGAVRHALPLIESDTILVMNGDSFIDADLNAYIDWFSEKGKQAAILLTRANDTDRYGRITVQEDGCILSFEEKVAKRGSGWINAGVYLLRKSLLESIPFGRASSLEMDLFPHLVDKGLYGYKSDSKFIDIGTPDSYAMAEDFFRFV